MFAERPDDSRMALLSLVARELNNTLDLEQILRRVLIATVRIAGAINGSFFVFDDQENLVKSLFVNSATVVEVEKKVVNHILSDGLAGWVKQHKKAALVTDASQDDRWYADKNNPDLLVHHSAISVPLLAGERILGVLTITHENRAYFDAADVTMLTAVAEQAVPAILNARLYQAEQNRRRLSNILSETFRRMNATHNLEELFELIMGQLALVIQYDQCAIFLLDKGYLTIAAARGIEHLLELKNLPVKLYKHDFAQPITEQGLPVLTADLQQENTWFRDTIDVAARSWMGIPLLAGDALTGLITIAGRTPDMYTPQDLEFAATLAGQAAVAIKNTSLFNQLQETRRRYARLFEGSSDLLMIISPEGIILDANRKACQLLRRPKDVLVGSHLALVDPTLKDVFSRQCDELAEGRELTTELIIKDAYGQPITLEISAKQAKIDGATAIQWAGRDVSARHELAKMRQDLTNMIVHDLRGPMGTLMGTVQMLQLLLGDIADTDIRQEAEDLMEIANRSGQYLKDLIDSVLDISRLEQGDSPLAIAPVSVTKLLTEVQEQTTPQADMKHVEITFVMPEQDYTAPMDHSMIRRVLVNLVDNAIKYTPPLGAIQVQANAENQILTLRVSDNGPGIPSDKQMHLFDKFTRATADNTIHGVGLGLAFCKLAVEAHHGEIWLESEPGRGTKFTFTIPYPLPAP